MQKLAEIRGDVKEIGWGSQIRSYVFMPYTMVKDHRTGEETGNVGAVMVGCHRHFISAYHAWFTAKRELERISQRSLGELKEIKITKNEENQRLDKYLLKYFNKAPKSFVYKMLRKKRIKLNKGKAEGSEMLLEGDTLQLYLAEETMAGFMEEKTVPVAERHFGIVYEDDRHSGGE